MSGILVVSDLHFKLGYHRSVFEGDALKWLFKIIDAHKPSDLVICGDSDDGWSLEDWSNLTDKIHVSAIAGNHENLSLLQSVKNNDGQLVWCKDSERRNIQGLEFGFINFIMALNSKRVKGGVPRKTPEDFWRCANQLKGVQVLITHESPWDESYGTRIHQAIGCLTMREILEQNGYPLAFSGHLAGPYTVAKIGLTTSVRIDSAPSEQCYVLVEKENSTTASIHVYHNLERIGSLLARL